MKKIFVGLALVITFIGVVFGREAQIEWTVYLGFPLVIFFGSAGLAFIRKRFEVIIGGMMIAALWPFLVESFKTALFALP